MLSGAEGCVDASAVDAEATLANVPAVFHALQCFKPLVLGERLIVRYVPYNYCETKRNRDIKASFNLLVFNINFCNRLECELPSMLSPRETKYLPLAEISRDRIGWRNEGE